MFREMRRKRQQLSQRECAEIFERGTSGVLALCGDDGYPYAVPISYFYEDGKIYFHSAKSGHKIDAVKREEKAGFCVIDQDEIIPEEYTTYFRSAVAFGKIRILEEDEKKRSAIEKLAVKYAPEASDKSLSMAIEREWKPLCMLEMTVEHMTGKEAIELVKSRRSGFDGRMEE